MRHREEVFWERSINSFEIVMIFFRIVCIFANVASYQVIECIFVD
jgi:hypothetical protein